MARGDEDDHSLPDRDAAKDFYAKYEPKEVLGKGVSSVVRRCVEKDTGVEYAAKIIDVSGDDKDVDGESVRDATQREIQILRLSAGHPYIIALHDVYESPTFIFLVLELCKNGELFDYLTNVVTLSEKKTRQVMKQLFEALDYIHSRNIVHRDIKPENILLDDNFNIKLTDFGFARQLQPEETLYSLCGTPAYLAPETLKAGMYEDTGGYCIPVDMWACGVIMYTLLVGCPPFWHRKQMIMLRNIMEGKYDFNSNEWNDITDSPKDLVAKLLVVDPANRITSCQALRHEFISAAGSARPSFSPRAKFRCAVWCIRAAVRIRKLKHTPEPLSVKVARIDPYRIKTLRKVIDGCAFRVYGHWVKKGEDQNRAALFENQCKVEVRIMQEGL